MVMIHGDNKGLVMPPRVAQYQVVLVPCGITAKTKEDAKNKVNDAIANAKSELSKVGVRVFADVREGYTPGYKFNDWEMKGVPVRIEIGPRDCEKEQVVAARRDNGEKSIIPMASLVSEVESLLKTIQQSLYDKANDSLKSHVVQARTWPDFVTALNNKNLVLIPWCGQEACEDDIKDRSGRPLQGEDAAPVDEKAPSMGAKSLCIPFDQPDGIVKGETKCAACDKDAVEWCMFGRSY